jgi:hypothetical protein
MAGENRIDLCSNHSGLRVDQIPGLADTEGLAMKLGKQPARPGAVTFKFSDFAAVSQMVAPPANFGHEKLIRRWGMGGNDVAGDCVFAGAKHEIMLWNAEVGKLVDISDATTLKNYSVFTGYDPSQTDPTTGENPTDQGTDVAQWLSYRRKVGFLDDHGQPHKIGAYIALEPGNADQLRYAAYYFDGVGIGVNFPQQWMDIFRQGGRTWPALRNPNYVGGHYITSVAFRDNRPVIVSWGAKVELTLGAYAQTSDEAYAYLTPEKLANGVDLQGFNYAKLTDYIKQLRSVR